jgi:nucleoside-diphosphate-sugar epimerase
MLHNTECTSVEIIKKLMNREMPLIPNISMPCCDVRVVAEAHIKAMNLPEANNQRHIIVTTKEATTFKEMALILDEEFKSKNYKVPTSVAPNCLIKIFSIFDKTVRMVIEISI